MERRRERDDDSRDDRRGGRERDDDTRGSRDRGRDRDDDRGSRDRGRDDDRGGRSRERDDDRGGRSRGGSSYEYQRRDESKLKDRAAGGDDFDRIIKGVKTFKPRDGDNCIRIMPPGWPKADHYGYDLYVHYGVGADRQTYLDLHKMCDKPDPIHEEREKFARTADTDDERDKAYLKDLEAKKRVGVFLIDRNDEKAGVQFWAMPQGLDRDIVKVSIDKSSGEVLPIDHPEEGFDVTFEKNGSGMKTKYEAANVARRSSPLSTREERMEEWLDYVTKNPIPDMLVFYDYDHIAKAFGGGGSHSGGDRGRDSGSHDRGRDDERGKGRDDERGSRDRGRDDRDGGRDKDRGRERNEAPKLDWESLHDMTRGELEDVIENERLRLNPEDFDSKKELADAICKKLDLDEPRGRGRDDDRGRDSDDRGRDRERTRDEPPARRRAAEDDDEARLGKMRERLRD